MTAKKKSSTPKRRSSHSRTTHKGRLHRLLFNRVTLFMTLSLAIISLAYVFYLDVRIRHQFEGKRWSIPARVYARPLELFPGKAMVPSELVTELKRLGYHEVETPKAPGEFHLQGARLELFTRAFTFWDGSEPARRLDLRFERNYLQQISNQDDGLAVSLFRVEPIQIATIFTSHYEDRLLIRLSDLPEYLPDILTLVEDRDFYQHHGVSPKAIARALVSNLRAGRTVQGGSTLTQQLVKNFFLSNERSLWRKANEAIMALLLEFHYDKDEILQAYLNEIYLAQDGRRAIHGVGLASQHYFGLNVTQLNLSQQALLVAMVKGPSYYDPRRHPERALERRNLVLGMMAEHGMVSVTQAHEAQQQPLGVNQRSHQRLTSYPAFVDLVKRQLHQDYAEEDLRSEGLRIFTTLDPAIQKAAEGAVSERLDYLERYYGIDQNRLQSAMVVAHPGSGEVTALVGGRDPRFAGYNRALDAVRPIGSLIKPVIYLNAWEQPLRYNMATLLEDAPMTLESEQGREWLPQNYDKKTHGRVPAYQALIHSYNLATLQLGMELGVNKVIASLRRMGISRPLNIYPSLLLGALELTPLEVAQIYQSLSNGGFSSPLRAIRAVVSLDGKPLQRYALEVKQAADPRAVYLVDRALQMVVEEGTAKALGELLPRELHLAGKTGTTDELRDSWFAGFSGDLLAVVWLGRDDNQPAGFSGSTGAMPIWAEMLRRAGSEPLRLLPPEEIEEQWIDSQTGLLSDEGCAHVLKLPFIVGSAPEQQSGCEKREGGTEQRREVWYKRWFR